MSKTVTLKGFVHVRDDYTGTPTYTMFSTDMSSNKWAGLCCGPASFEYTIPDTFNPVAAETASLEKQKNELTADFANSVARINERLSKLQAIGNEVAP